MTPTYNGKGNFDGAAIQLDDPFELPRDAPLVIAVVSPSDANELRGDWFSLAEQCLSRACGDDEPDYSEADVIE